MENAIVVKQIPIIDYSKLEFLSVELEKNLKSYDINSLVVNEETVKEVKRFRTGVRKEFKELEDMRKALKNEIEAPYKEFLEFYKDNIQDMYKDADSALKESIDKVEDELRKEKEEVLRQRFEDLKFKEGLDFPNFEQLGVNVTISASESSLITEVDNHFNQIMQDLFIIETQSEPTRVLVRYKQNLNLQESIIQVTNEVEEEKELLKKQQELQEEQIEVIERVEEEFKEVETFVGKETEEETKEVKFTVVGTQREVNLIRNFLRSSGITYKGAIQ